VNGQYRAGLVLWIIGAALWLVIMYSFFTLVTVREHKPTIETGLNGGWLIAVVSTQSISVLGTLLSAQWGNYREPLLFLTLCLFLLGCMLYLLLITLILSQPFNTRRVRPITQVRKFSPLLFIIWRKSSTDAYRHDGCTAIPLFMAANQQTLRSNQSKPANKGVRIKTIALPAEHSGWGFLFEPIVLPSCCR
jgi:hypothetical protein